MLAALPASQPPPPVARLRAPPRRPMPSEQRAAFESQVAAARESAARARVEERAAAHSSVALADVLRPGDAAAPRAPAQSPLGGVPVAGPPPSPPPPPPQSLRHFREMAPTASDVGMGAALELAAARRPTAAEKARYAGELLQQAAAAEAARAAARAERRAPPAATQLLPPQPQPQQQPQQQQQQQQALSTRHIQRDGALGDVLLPQPPQPPPAPMQGPTPAREAATATVETPPPRDAQRHALLQRRQQQAAYASALDAQAAAAAASRLRDASQQPRGLKRQPALDAARRSGGSDDESTDGAGVGVLPAAVRGHGRRLSLAGASALVPMPAHPHPPSPAHPGVGRNGADLPSPPVDEAALPGATHRRGVRELQAGLSVEQHARRVSMRAAAAAALDAQLAELLARRATEAAREAAAVVREDARVARERQELVERHARETAGEERARQAAQSAAGGESAGASGHAAVDATAPQPAATAVDGAGSSNHACVDGAAPSALVLQRWRARRAAVRGRGGRVLDDVLPGPGLDAAGWQGDAPATAVAAPTLPLLLCGAETDGAAGLTAAPLDLAPVVARQAAELAALRLQLEARLEPPADPLLLAHRPRVLEEARPPPAAEYAGAGAAPPHHRSFTPLTLLPPGAVARAAGAISRLALLRKLLPPPRPASAASLHGPPLEGLPSTFVRLGDTDEQRRPTSPVAPPALHVSNPPIPSFPIDPGCGAATRLQLPSKLPISRTRGKWVGQREGAQCEASAVSSSSLEHASTTLSSPTATTRDRGFDVAVAMQVNRGRLRRLSAHSAACRLTRRTPSGERRRGSSDLGVGYYAATPKSSASESGTATHPSTRRRAQLQHWGRHAAPSPRARRAGQAGRRRAARSAEGAHRASAFATDAPTHAPPGWSRQPFNVSWDPTPHPHALWSLSPLQAGVAPLHLHPYHPHMHPPQSYVAEWGQPLTASSWGAPMGAPHAAKQPGRAHVTRRQRGREAGGRD